jgi:hypothetical protein
MGDGNFHCDDHNFTYDWRDECPECKNEAIKKHRDELEEELDQLRTDLAQAREEAEGLREALEKYEWATFDNHCLDCCAQEPDEEYKKDRTPLRGHYGWCKIGKALHGKNTNPTDGD